MDDMYAETDCEADVRRRKGFSFPFSVGGFNFINEKNRTNPTFSL